MDTRYYNHLQHSYDIFWNDISHKEGKTLLETQVKVAEMMTESINKNIDNENKEATLNKTVPSKTKILNIIKLYHATNTVLIKGSQKSTWVNKESPILKEVRYNCSAHHSAHLFIIPISSHSHT